MDRFRKFVSEWQDALIWVPGALLLLIAVTLILPLFDPRAGIDGLGFLQGYAALLFKGVLATFMAWLCKRTYTKDLDDGDEALLMRTAQSTTPWPLAIDRLEWAFWVGFWYFVLSS